MSIFRPGQRVLVTDPALKAMREILRARMPAGKEMAPNHHGTVESVWDDGTVLINFDDGGCAPYPDAEVRLL